MRSKDLAPALGSLLYDPAMPEPSLQILLDWADIAANPASMRAFGLSRLGRVLPAMVRAYIASHHYRLERAADQDQESDRLVLHDTGNGAVVGRVMMLLTEVIAPAHGAAGRRARASIEERPCATPLRGDRPDRAPLTAGAAPGTAPPAPAAAGRCGLGP